MQILLAVIVALFLYVLSMGPLVYLFYSEAIDADWYISVRDTVYAPLRPWWIHEEAGEDRGVGSGIYTAYLDWWARLAL